MSYVQAALTCPRIGRADYTAGKPIEANPYKLGTYCARLYADGWLAAWLSS